VTDMPGEDEAVLAAEARLAFDADLAGLPAAPNENGSASSQRDGSGDQEEVSLCANAEMDTQKMPAFGGTFFVTSNAPCGGVSWVGTLQNR